MKVQKKQGLQLIKMLEKSEYPVERAPMQVQVRVMNEKEMLEAVKEVVTSVDKLGVNEDNYVLECLIQPDKYRDLDKLVTKELKGDLEVLQLAVRLMDECALTDKHEEAEPVAELSEKPIAVKKTGGKKDSKKEDGFVSATAPGVVFPTREAMREHMKSDWHKFNLKRKTSGQEMLDYDAYREACVDGDFFN